MAAKVEMILQQEASEVLPDVKMHFTMESDNDLEMKIGNLLIAIVHRSLEEMVKSLKGNSRITSTVDVEMYLTYYGIEINLL